MFQISRFFALRRGQPLYIFKGQNFLSRFHCNMFDGLNNPSFETHRSIMNLNDTIIVYSSNRPSSLGGLDTRVVWTIRVKTLRPLPRWLTPMYSQVVVF